MESIEKILYTLKHWVDTFQVSPQQIKIETRYKKIIDYK